MGEKSNPQSEQFAGSPKMGEPVFLVIGKLRRPHGLRGEALMEVITDFPERLQAGTPVYVGPEHIRLHIRSVRKQDRQLLVTFEEYSTPEQVGAQRNQYVYVRADDRPELEAGEYYHHQLLNLQVVDENGVTLGKVFDILETGANDVLVVRRDSGPDVLVPFIESLLLEVQIDQGYLRVRLLPGLLDPK
jgi:16S rRNA processing protein RimM